MKNLDAIFSPKSIAVLGASQTPGKVGHDIFANILKGGYKGVLYPVNPSTKSVLSVRSYPSVTDIPDEVDLAFIILPPKIALNAVELSIAKGVKGIVIVSAGFREVGGEGLDIEKKIISLCADAGVRVIGPNCLGVINPSPSVSLNASFSKRMPEVGKISFISQSGALCTAALDFASDRNFGFSKFISIGNKADVDELDLLRYFHTDKETQVIMIYLEELRRPSHEFITTVKEITSGERPTPVLVIKSGKTAAGAQAAASHTGALAGSEAVYDSLFKQSGIIRADTIDELFDYASVFVCKSESGMGKVKRKVPNGNRVAIVTNAGGPGIVATDVTVSSGLELAKFTPETIEILASHLPSAANLNNPVDIIGDAAQDRYKNALDTVIKDEGVDGALVILTPQSMTDTLGAAEAVVKIAKRSHKPIVSCFMGVIDVSPGVKYLQKHGYPVFRFPENAAKALSALYRYSKWLNRPYLAQFKLTHNKKKASKIIADALAAGKTHLGELEGNEILKCYGFNVLPTILAKTDQDAVDIAKKMAFPVAMKIVSPQIIHKSDAGGVLIGRATEEEVKDGFNQIVENAKQFDPNAEITGVLIQKMAPTGDEVILGMNRYPLFGPLLMFGLGGVFVEIFQDVEFRFAPVLRNEARRMIRETKAYKLFNGFRGRPVADVETLEKMIVCLSDMSIHHPEIKELDINPLLVHAKGKGATVADCRIILEKPHDDATDAEKS